MNFILMLKVKKILDARENSEEKYSSDKENDRDESRIGDVNKSYLKKNLKQKVLSAKNGSVFVKTENGDVSEQSTSGASSTVVELNGVKQEEEETTEEVRKLLKKSSFVPFIKRFLLHLHKEKSIMFLFSIEILKY